MGLSKLNEEIRRCTGCRLSQTRTNALCGEGDPNTRLMLIAQAPGEKEDARGEMFIGPSGGILDEMLDEAGIGREEVYMTNLLKCMLPRYRKPKMDEIEACRGYLDAEIEAVNPQFLVPLGYYATRYAFEKCNLPLPSKKEFREVYGKLLWAGGKKLFPLRHPAAALHDSSVKEAMKTNYSRLSVLKADCKWAPT